MPSSTELEHARYWRRRSEEIRAQANETHDASVKRMLLEAADSYQRLAEMVENKIPG